MKLKGAARVLGAQEYTRQLKNRVVAKSIDTSPQPAHRRYNYVPISVTGNRANRVVQLVSVPQKSCSGGWTTESGCCFNACSDSVELVIDSQGQPCECSAYEVSIGCPGLPLLAPFDCPKKVITIRFSPTSFEGEGTNLFFVSGQPYTSLVGAIVTVDGVPATLLPGFDDNSMVILGSFTTSSVIVITLPTPINGVGAACVNFVLG